MPAGRPKSTEPTKDKRVSMRVKEDEYQRIMAYAEKHKMTVAELIGEALNQYMEQKP